MRLRLIVILIALVVISACIRETDMEGVPEATFSGDIQRILSANCNFPDCHGVGGEETGLNTYEEVKGHVEAGNARQSTLYRVVTGRSTEEMPPSGYAKLSGDDIRLIYIWIEQGAKNN
jgi:hypothetical protein